MTLTPAYGRDYKNKKSVLADWHDNKDFIVADVFSKWSDKPANKESLVNEPSILIRYARLTKVLVVR
jgi:hypothetical protein